MDVGELDEDGLLKFSGEIHNKLLRKTGAEKLLEAAKLANDQGLDLEIHSLFRSLERQKTEFDLIRADFEKDHPNASELEIWEMTTQFIADPSLAPPHCTGSAVDLRLLDKKGELLDMGVPINTVDEKSYLMSDQISFEAKENRNILLNILLKAGFAPLATEWWHYSYGDCYWAAFYNQKALHDVI